MRKNNRNRTEYRPDLNGARLEERVVLSLPPGFNFVGPNQVAQLRAAVARASRSIEFGVRTQIQAQARQLFAAGTPTPQQIANFDANAQGAIVSGASALANMLAVLPHTRTNLVPLAARAFLANGQNSLLSRVNNLVNNSSAMSSLPQLQAALAQDVRSVFGNVSAQTAQFFANQNFNNDVLNASDGSETLSQFIGDRIITQFANNLGNLASAFPTVANAVLFGNGVTSATTGRDSSNFNQMVTRGAGPGRVQPCKRAPTVARGNQPHPDASELDIWHRQHDGRHGDNRHRANHPREFYLDVAIATHDEHSLRHCLADRIFHGVF